MDKIFGQQRQRPTRVAARLQRRQAYHRPHRPGFVRHEVLVLLPDRRHPARGDPADREAGRRRRDDSALHASTFPAPKPAAWIALPDHPARDLYRALFPALVALHPERTDNPATDQRGAVALHPMPTSCGRTLTPLPSLWPPCPIRPPACKPPSVSGRGLFVRLCLAFHLIEIAAARVRGEPVPPSTSSPPRPPNGSAAICVASSRPTCGAPSDDVRHRPNRACRLDRSLHPGPAPGSDHHAGPHALRPTGPAIARRTPGTRERHGGPVRVRLADGQSCATPSRPPPGPSIPRCTSSSPSAPKPSGSAGPQCGRPSSRAFGGTPKRTADGTRPTTPGRTRLIQHAADTTVNLTNRAAWIAILDILARPACPDRAQARVVVWAARKRLRRRRRCADLSQMHGKPRGHFGGILRQIAHQSHGKLRLSTSRESFNPPSAVANVACADAGIRTNRQSERVFEYVPHTPATFATAPPMARSVAGRA